MVRLADLAAELGDAVVLDGDPSTDVDGVTNDSRSVRPGMLFCCVPGALTDGHRFAPDAVEAGAVALLCERTLDLAVPELVVAEARPAMGPVAARAYGHPSKAMDVVGVTGTNGKTTTVAFLEAILTAAGRPTATIGTLSGVRTTPDVPELQARLSALRDAGTSAVAMEVSSHALALHRVTGTRFAVAVFTNLGRDHLDFHETQEAYFAAKARLFEPDFAVAAVVNADDPHGRLLLDAARVPTTPFALADATDLEVGLRESNGRWRGQRLRVPLGGADNVANALAALTAAVELGIDPGTAVEGLAEAGPVPGRLEVVESNRPYTVLVDFAHTPDGLEQALRAARTGARRVLVVFGAGGDKDREKRPSMGEIATRLADVVVLTSDNPRSEDPATIVEAIRAGATGPAKVLVEVDRRAAIALALGEAEPGDVVVVAGKGHETTQLIGDRVLPFDDRDVVRELLA